MQVGVVEAATGSEEVRDHLGPAPQVGVPADGPPCREDQVEAGRFGQRLRCPVNVRQHEPRRQAQLRRVLPRRLDRRRREVHPGHLSPALRQDQAVLPEMALQMQHSQPGDRAELRLLDRAKPRRPVPERLLVHRRGPVNGDPLIPVRPVQREPVRVRH